MTMNVAVTDDGLLQLTIDSMVYPPLTIDAVNALVAAIPAAQASSARAALTRAMRGLTNVLASSQNLTATFTITDNTATVTVDPATFATIQQRWNLQPDPTTGALTLGPVTISQGA